ncbi:hypothetical protein [Isoptericola variabilis]|uniref:N-acetyltransferase domain-containing protein n=1 Tax=Isoptericola variabilis (strain 225) TaxID=743718 RepID=F6FSC7_ISOV2|nr:hypothetical protein [Isoptericola variabilis]AEG43068.1 hypothetical protein Isova_0265 [Isoptericola variabilis 225]TWH28148.1 hypothetical protein L600_004500000020 [Isoptericola variabilis J7]
MVPWLEVFGWLGSILIVFSLTQARVLRFRWLNLTGSVIATVYNAIFTIWPFAAMNGAIALINVYWLVRLYREAHDAATYEVVEVAPDDAYLRHVLRTHADDIAHWSPGFDPHADPAGRSAFLVQRGDETVGVVVVRDAGGGEGVVELDWVSRRFRDFTPGEFVHRDSGIFTGRGFTRVVTSLDAVKDAAYLERMGFVPDDGRWVRELARAA